jgi:hypothetical protein
LDPNEVNLGQPTKSADYVIFNYFADVPSQQVKMPLSRIAYATMKGQDLAVLELQARYDEVVRRGFKPWRVTSGVPAVNEPVVIVGAPLSGAPSAPFVHLCACDLESRAKILLEDVWHWFDFDRNRCSDLGPGSSGSPVISRQTGRLVGLLNTSTIGAPRFTDCALNHPCEPVHGDVTSYTDTSYMTPLVSVDRCFNEKGRFDVMRRGCPLDTNEQVQMTPGALGAVNPRQTKPIVGLPRHRWNVTVSGKFDQYRYKVIAALSGDCRDIRGYGALRGVREHPVIDDPLPVTEGFHFLCVLGATAKRSSARKQSVYHPTVVTVRIDTVSPKIPASIAIEEFDPAWVVSFKTLDPEISTYQYKVGRPGETRCDDLDGYDPVGDPVLALLKTNRPYKLCAIPYDSALNPGPIFEKLLP